MNGKWGHLFNENAMAALVSFRYVGGNAIIKMVIKIVLKLWSQLIYSWNEMN